MLEVELASKEKEGGIRILLIEDDERLARLTTRYLESHGLSVVWIDDGRRGLTEALARPYDLVLLDLMLPGMDGMEVCRQLRTRTDVPIIVLTARGEEVDRVIGLEGGADDYVGKPFSSRELLARIRATVRRARGRAGPEASALLVGALELDVGGRRATLAGHQLSLTTYEFALLHVLVSRAGRVLSRDQLLELTRGNAEDVFDRSIDVHVSRLRQKLGDDPRNPRLLKTIRGAGYMFSTPVQT